MIVRYRRTWASIASRFSECDAMMFAWPAAAGSVLTHIVAILFYFGWRRTLHRVQVASHSWMRDVDQRCSTGRAGPAHRRHDGEHLTCMMSASTASLLDSPATLIIHSDARTNRTRGEIDANLAYPTSAHPASGTGCRTVGGSRRRSLCSRSSSSRGRSGCRGHSPQHTRHATGILRGRASMPCSRSVSRRRRSACPALALALRGGERIGHAARRRCVVRRPHCTPRRGVRTIDANASVGGNAENGAS